MLSYAVLGSSSALQLNVCHWQSYGLTSALFAGVYAAETSIS